MSQGKRFPVPIEVTDTFFPPRTSHFSKGQNLPVPDQVADEHPKSHVYRPRGSRKL